MIELEALTRRYGETTVVDRVSLRVEAGELLVLLGGSGSGKTTTLKMINRLIEPTSGVVKLEGADVAGLAPHELRRRIGYAFQAIGLFPHLTVGENIAITPRLLGWDASRIAARVDDLLARVDLEPAKFRGRFPHELSGGQAQRVGVARALAAEPRVVLFDEPFGALDPLTRARLQDELLALRRDLSLTAIFVTHDIDEALLLADRIAVMREGRIVQLGAPRDLLQAPADDYVRELFATTTRRTERLRALETPQTTP